jgi:hypothetical protein
VSTDLDRLEAFYSRVDTDRGRAVVALVTELRVARRVVGTRHATPAKGNSLVWDIWWDTHHGPALAAYDQAVSP